jgi:hypothetical protein
MGRIGYGNEESKDGGEGKYGRGEGKSSDRDRPRDKGKDEAPKRTIDVRIISGSHGHVVSVLKVQVCPKPFVVNRTLRFFEQENSIMKRRICRTGVSQSLYPGESVAESKFVHCVDAGSSENKVVVEWGPSSSSGAAGDSLDILLRYRCMGYPSTGSFYILIYDDPYQSKLDEVWHVVVESRL